MAKLHKIKIVHEYLVDIDIPDGMTVEEAVEDWLDMGELDVEDPNSYSIEDHGEGFWEE
jgi:hypothetical protein